MEAHVWMASTRTHVAVIWDLQVPIANITSTHVMLSLVSMGQHVTIKKALISVTVRLGLLVLAVRILWIGAIEVHVKMVQPAFKWPISFNVSVEKAGQDSCVMSVWSLVVLLQDKEVWM